METRRQIPIAAPSTGEDEWIALRAPLESGWLTQGPKVAEFERAFAAHHKVEYAIAASSCTTALHLILAAMEIGPGDEIIVPAFTWVATSNVVVYCGATPVFADVDRRTYNIDPADVTRKVTPRTRAIIAVHLFGLCADIEALARAAPGVPIVEDAACAAGATYMGRHAGSLGLAAAFSFHPRKSITTGEGGMVTTSNEALAERVNRLRNHGASVSEEQRHLGPKPYLLPSFNLLGYNYRMTDLQGAVGLVQLGKLERFVSERSRGASSYRETLQDIDWLQLPREPAKGQHAWQAFVAYVDPKLAPRPRNEIMQALHERGVATRPGTHAIHMLGYYRRRFRFLPEHFPAALDCERNSMALPLHNRMTAEDYEYVVESLHSI
ncbi:MAG: DegT/DnrJ/EryC1/StrS family aminotransferase [Woeseiaceae bacterium]